MAKIFGILTTVVLLMSLFVASKNKSRYEDEIVRVIAEKDRLAVSQERLATAQTKLSQLEAEIPVVRQETSELVAQGEEQRATNSRLESELQTKSANVARNREQIALLQERIGSFGNLENLKQSLRSLQEELQALNDPESGIPALDERLEQLATQATQMEADNTVATNILEGYARGESRPGMNTRIRSLYPNWGFVTLASGGISGIAGNSTMDVIRDNQIIAKLQVTAVEPNSATATIIPGSLVDDVTLSVGDTVVPGTRLENN